MLSMELAGSTIDHTVVIRGKRTKRHRPPSPLGAGSTSTSGEEEEDMANCLILLAQGAVTKITRHQEECDVSELTEKVGLYVYECKTCNRTFPSFQALGGHRASHKRPKTAKEKADVAVEEKRSTVTASHIPIEQSGSVVTVDYTEKLARNWHSPPLSLQFNKSSFNFSNKSSKIHECSICGSEFTSGQALGGHMRRHRAAAAATTTTTITSTVDQHEEEIKRGRKILLLDLNLPAPEDDPGDFQFTSAKQSIVFSAPALVDCPIF